MRRALRLLAAPAVPALLALPLFATSPSAAGRFGPQEALARGHELAAHVVNNQPGPLWPLFAPRMAEALRDSANFAATLSAIRGLTGKADSVLNERVAEEKGALVYRADCRFAKQDVPWTVSIAFDDRARIIGLFVRPSATPAAGDSTHVDSTGTEKGRKARPAR